MDDNVTKLLEQLATKLGTTTEYLWAITVKEAQLAAITNLIYMAMTIVAWIPFWKVHYYLLNEKNSMNYENNDWVGVVMVVLAVILLVLTIGTFSTIREIIDGFFNPEFWAFDYILGMLK